MKYIPCPGIRRITKQENLAHAIRYNNNCCNLLMATIRMVAIQCFLTTCFFMVQHICIGQQIRIVSPTASQLKTGIPRITFSVAEGSYPEQIMHLFITEVSRQSDQEVTYEESSPLSTRNLQAVPACSLTVEDWLKKIRSQIPRLTWTNTNGVFHVALVQLKSRHNPLDDTINMDYTGSMSIDAWYDWIRDQLPKDDFFVSADIYTNFGGSLFPAVNDVHKTVVIQVSRNETIRQFLSDWAGSYKGTWAARIKVTRNSKSISIVCIR